MQLSINSGLAAPSHDTPLVYAITLPNPNWLTTTLYEAPPCFCRMRSFVAHVGLRLPFSLVSLPRFLELVSFLPTLCAVRIYLFTCSISSWNWCIQSDRHRHSQTHKHTSRLRRKPHSRSDAKEAEIARRRIFVRSLDIDRKLAHVT